MSRPLVTAARLLRPLIHLHGRLTRGVSLESRALVLTRDGQVLLVREHPEDPYDLPGGLAPAGAPPLEALKTTLRAETGLKDVEGLRLQSIHQAEAAGEADHILVFRLLLQSGAAVSLEGAARVWRGPAEAGLEVGRGRRRWLEQDLAAALTRMRAGGRD